MNIRYTSICFLLMVVLLFFATCKEEKSEKKKVQKKHISFKLDQSGEGKAEVVDLRSLEQMKVDSFLKRKKYEEAYVLLESIEDDLYSICQKASTCIKLRKYKQASALLIESKRLIQDQQLTDSFLLAHYYLYQGEYFFRTKNLEEAITSLKEALLFGEKGFKSIPERLAISNAFLGTIYRYYLQDILKAEDYFLREHRVIERVNLEDRKINCYYNLATTYRLKGQYEKGLTFGLKAYQRAKEEKKMSMLIRCLIMLGNLYGDSGDYEKATTKYEEAIDLVLVTGLNENRLFRYYAQLGVFFSREGNYLAAEVAIRKGLLLSNEEDSEGLLETYSTLGYNFVNQGKLDSAKYYYQKVIHLAEENLPVHHPGFLRYYIDYSWALKLNGELDSALVYANKSLTHITASNSLCLANLRSTEDASELLAEKGDVLRRTYFKNPRRLNFLEEAYQAYLLADSLMLDRRSYKEESASLHELEHYHDIYSAAIETAALLYKETNNAEFVEMAYRLMDRSKGVILYESVAANEQLGEGLIPLELFEKEQEVKSALESVYLDYQKVIAEESKELAEWNEEKLKWLTVQDSLSNELSKRYPHYSEAKYQFDIPSLEKLSKQLKAERSQLLQYHVSDSLLQGMLISADTILYFKSKAIEKLKANVAQLIHEMTTPPQINDGGEVFTQFCMASYQLYNDLIAPALISSEGGGRLIIIPDGFLSEIPFEILIRSMPEKKESVDYRSLDYLISDFSIHYEYSVKTYLRPNDDSKEKGNDILLAFSYSDTNEGLVEDALAEVNRNKKLNDLPASSREVDEIKNTLSSHSSLLFKGSKATKANFFKFASDADIIHLAVHADADLSNPYGNQIFFRENHDDPEGEISLYAYDLYPLGLKAQLAVLSACETARGRSYKGEGVYSFGRAFSYAGVSSLVMSLWSANDQSTANIMVDFYKQLNSGACKDIALQQAKLKYIEQGDEFLAHPYFWSPFIQVGDAAAIIKPSYTIWWIGGFISLLVALIMLLSFANNRI